MKPGEFNFLRALKECARPEYDALPEKTKILHEELRRNYDEVLGQDSDFLVCWPKPEEEMVDRLPLRERFEAMNTEELARASHVVHQYSNWGGGGSRKFSDLADQVICSKLGLTREPNHRPVGLSVHNGSLRLHKSTKDEWLWQDICLATQESLDTCKENLGGNYETSLKNLTKLFPETHRLGICDTSRFIVLSPEEKDVDGALEGSGLKRHDIANVNFRPHPFIIGDKHLQNSYGMTLDPDCAPCASPGCNLAYDEHKSDRVLFIKVASDDLSDEQKEVLQSMAPMLEKYGIDGLAFVKED